VRVAAVVAFLVAAGLFGMPFVLGLYECAECSTDADCPKGQSCRPFSDGQSRCTRRESMCQPGHITTGKTWWTVGAVAAGIVGAYLWWLGSAGKNAPPAEG
jgi:Cys-rich repeat protein